MVWFTHPFLLNHSFVLACIEYNHKVSVLISYSVLLIFHHLIEIVAIALIYEFYPVISYLLYLITPMWIEVDHSLLTHPFLHSHILSSQQ